jgi:signal transduction histidine kinase/CheY-like chemotaxis protein
MMDSFELRSSPGNGTSVAFRKNLKDKRRLDKRDIEAVARRLAAERPQGASAEVQTQNRELMAALYELRAREQELDRRVADLARLNAELEETNRGVVALYSELDERALALHRADELKGRFLSHVSHEFRTPLNSILALTRLLLDRVDGDLAAEQEKQVGFIRQAAQDLIEIVNDLLDLAKVDAGKTEVVKAPVELRQILGVLRGMMRPLAVSESVALLIEEPAEPVEIVSDESKIAQILRNLVSNALKFTERGSVRVTCALSDSGETVGISVADTGIGIGPENLDLIFQEFTQVSSRLQRKVKGTGLGLPLSRKLATLLGGSLTVVSRPGEGSTFTLALPTGRPAPLITADYAGSSDAILIIDDEETSRYLVRHMFRNSNRRLIEASSGIEGAERARFERPALVFLDLIMPGRSGFEVLDELKSDPSTTAIPVVIHSSKPLGKEDYDRLGGRHVAVLPKSGKDRAAALTAIRDILREPGLFADELGAAGL